MSDYRYCLGCNNAMPDEKFTEHREDDVNWSELRCECGASDFEEITPTWALEQIKTAYTLMRLQHKDDPYWMDKADRLSAAEDVLEALET